MTWREEHRPQIERVGLVAIVVAFWTVVVLIAALVFNLAPLDVVGRFLLGLGGLVGVAEFAAGVLPWIVRAWRRAGVRQETAAAGAAALRLVRR